MPTAKKAVAKKAAAPKPKPKSEDDPLDQEPVSGVVEVGPSIPAPITPSTPGEAAQDRVLWENSVNDAARDFGRQAELAFIEATIAGKSLSLTISEE